MATNAIPKKLDPLRTLAEDAADGAAIYEAGIGLKQNTEAAIRADLASLDDAQTVHLAAQKAKGKLYTAQRSADSNGRAFIGNASNVLGNYLGTSWSTAWSETGFPNQSTAVPSTLAERQALLSSLKTYFTNHPEHENAPLGVTAAQAAALFTALSDARSAANNGLTVAGQKRKARDLAQRKLTKRLRGLVTELGQLLEGDDPIWLAFGLNMPDSETTPEAPTNLVLTEGGPGEVLADWDDVANADRYCVFKQEVGVDAEFVRFGSPQDSDFTLSGLTPGKTLRVKVSAASGSLEGPAGDVAEIVVGGSTLPTARYNMAQTSPDTADVWIEMIDGLTDVKSLLLREDTKEFVTTFSPQPGEVFKTTWTGVVISGDIDEVNIRNGQNEDIAIGVFDPTLPDPGT